jgi:hypothetical protein
VTVLPPTDPIEPTLLSSVTLVGVYSEELEAALDEDNKTFTVKRSGGMRFYKLRSADEAKLKVTSIRVQAGDAVIAYEIVEE